MSRIAFNGNALGTGTVTITSPNTNTDQTVTLPDQTGTLVLSGNAASFSSVAVSAGSAAAPSISPTGDSNTGMFFPAADTIAFAEGGAEVARFDSSGNLLVGTTTTGSTGVSLNSTYNVGWTQSAGESIPNIFRQTSSAATVMANGYRFSATSNGFASSFSSSYAKCAISCGTAAGAITFYTDTAAAVAAGTDVTPTERARIDSSGNLLVGRTDTAFTSGQPGMCVLPTQGITFTKTTSPNLGACMYLHRTFGAGTGNLVEFAYDTVTRGSISTNGSTVSYNTSSDYRLKNTIAPMTGALAKVALLKPCTYKWNADGSDGQGFIAHELAEVEPGCVTGEKDAVDADGNPQYQGIDTSFLVATLTAAIQEQQAMITAQASAITALTARIAALEGTQP
jgi:hypothetical protein